MSDDHTTLRARLVAIDDELRSLPTDAFADKHALNTEADGLRSVLRTELSADLDAASDEWAERAGRKGTHSVNESEKAAAAAVVSPGEGGNH